VKRFVAVYIGTHDAHSRAQWDRLDPAERAAREKAGMVAWMKWGATHAAAARMFADHPHFAIFPGDSVEIMECLPIPGR